MDIKEIIEQIAKDDQQELYSLACTVDDVNEGERTCSVTPLNGGVAVFGVRLQAIKGTEKGLVIFPKVGSQAIVTFINKQTGYLALHTEIDGYIIETGSESLKTILTDLIEAIEQLTVTTGVGPSGVPINLPAFTAIKTRLDGLLKA